MSQHKEPLMIRRGSSCSLPLPEGLHLAGEEDYEGYMREVNTPWRRQFVKEGSLDRSLGMQLRYYHAPKENAKGTIVMLHGYCGFFGKFHETMEYFWRAGYEVFFLEQRGHGYSGRQIESKDMVHVDAYEDYLADLKALMEEVVKIKDQAKPYILYGHSMGGAVAALYLEEYPEDFDLAILSSPMFAIETGKASPLLVKLLCAKIRLLRQHKEPFPGGRAWDGIPSFESSSCMSRARYDYIFQQRVADEHYQTNRLSNGWGVSSFRATARLRRHANRVKIPVLLFNAGADTLVREEGHALFASESANTEYVSYEGAKHELYNGDDAVRRDYYARIFDFLERKRAALLG